MSVVLKDASFEYGKQPIISSVNLSIEGPEVTAIIGANGSGKSTLMKLLTGQLKPSKGSVEIFGRSAGHRRLRADVGIAAQVIGFPDRLTPNEVLKLVSAHYSSPIPIDSLATMFGLGTFRNQRCGSLSGGMQRRLALACALAGRPRLLLLDEPMTGVDASSRREFHNSIRVYQKTHTCQVIMITHHPDEVTDLVDRFLLLRKLGQPRIVHPRELQSWTGMRSISFRSSHSPQFPVSGDVIADKQGEYKIFANNADEVVSQLVRQAHTFSDLCVRPLSTEEILERCSL